VATGNTLEAVIAVWALRRRERFDFGLTRVADAVAFLTLAAIASTTVSATIGVTTLCVSGAQDWGKFNVLWFDWWLGDATGAAIVAPVILTFARHAQSPRRRFVEIVALAAASTAATGLVFGLVADPSGAHPLEYVIFPFVVAAAVRGGPPASALAALGSSSVAIWHTVGGSGPFGGPAVHESLILLQAFMGVIAGTGMLLAAAISEREIGERRRDAAYAAGEVLSSAPDLETAAPAIVRSICEHLHWDTGALWRVDPEQQRLVCIAFHHQGSATAFAERTAAMSLERGVGLPGRVWADGSAVWIADVTREENFPRKAVAMASGLRAGFGFPLRAGGDVAGVIECFNRATIPADPDLLRTMSAVGNQIGQFIARKRHEAEVLRARAAAEAASLAKDDFIANLSHELRTPLNAILGWTQILSGGRSDPATAARALQVIDRNAHAQARLIDDILDVSRIITGGIRLDIEEVDLGAVIALACDAVRPLAHARQVTLTQSVEDGAARTAGDPKRLQQVVWNLLTNAVKFSRPGGTIAVTVRRAGDTTEIRVKDDGAGIEPAFLPYVFERFRQGDESVSRQHGGLGLGLAIVRHLVELHGGTVHATSDGSGTGATFTILLPARETLPRA
jgi:signal transduction histidine kinase